MIIIIIINYSNVIAVRVRTWKLILVDALFSFSVELEKLVLNSIVNACGRKNDYLFPCSLLYRVQTTKFRGKSAPQVVYLDNCFKDPVLIVRSPRAKIMRPRERGLIICSCVIFNMLNLYLRWTECASHFVSWFILWEIWWLNSVRVYRGNWWRDIGIWTCHQERYSRERNGDW